MDVEQVHVSIVGPGTVSIGWASESGRSDVVEVQEVDEQQAPLGDLQRVSSTSERYELQCGRRFKLNGPCAMSQRYRSPLLLQARVTLEPGRKYRYRLGGGAWRRLRLPPAVSQNAVSALKVAMVGDIGQTQNSAATCRDIRAHADELDLGVILGDLSYADSNASRWDSFHRLFDLQGCADIPWLVLPGNHEIEADDLSGENFVPYRKRWRTPEVKPEVVSNDSEVISWLRYDFRCRYDFGGSWYSFSTGPAHFVTLNPYCTNSKPSAQIQWLDEDLKGFSRERTPFLVVLTHAPWLHSSRTHRPENEVATVQLRSSAQPLLANKMDLMFSGHVHAYERSKPVEGTRYIVVGHGGNNEKLYNRWIESQTSAFRSGDHYGWGILTLSPGGHGNFQARRSVDGAVMDSFDFARENEAIEVTGDSAAFWASMVLFCLGCGLCLCCCLVYRHARLADEEEKSSLKDAVTVGNAM